GYCVTAHVCGVLVAGFVFWYAPVQWRRPVATPAAIRPKRAIALLLAGLAASGVLIAGQLLATPQPKDMRIVRLIGSSGSSIALDVREYPRIGKADAKYVVVDLYNYNCAHC